MDLSNRGGQRRPLAPSSRDNEVKNLESVPRDDLKLPPPYERSRYREYRYSLQEPSAHTVRPQEPFEVMPANGETHHYTFRHTLPDRLPNPFGEDGPVTLPPVTVQSPPHGVPPSVHPRQLREDARQSPLRIRTDAATLHVTTTERQSQTIVQKPTPAGIQSTVTRTNNESLKTLNPREQMYTVNRQDRPEIADELKFMNIKNIISINTQVPPQDQLPTDLAHYHKRFRFRSEESANGPSSVERTVEALRNVGERFSTKVHESVSKGKPVAVHCDGVSASPTLLAFYLMTKHNRTLEAALRAILRAWPSACPDPLFFLALKRHEQELLKCSTLPAGLQSLPTSETQRLAWFQSMNLAEDYNKNELKNLTNARVRRIAKLTQRTHLYIGTVGAAKNPEDMRSNNITYTIGVGEKVQKTERVSGINYSKVYFESTEYADLVSILSALRKEVYRADQFMNGNALIYDAVNGNFAVVVAAGLLISMAGISLYAALKTCLALYPDACPLPSFIEQLMFLELKNTGAKQSSLTDPELPRNREERLARFGLKVPRSSREGPRK